MASLAPSSSASVSYLTILCGGVVSEFGTVSYWFLCFWFFSSPPLQYAFLRFRLSLHLRIWLLSPCLYWALSPSSYSLSIKVTAFIYRWIWSLRSIAALDSSLSKWWFVNWCRLRFRSQRVLFYELSPFVVGRFRLPVVGVPGKNCRRRWSGGLTQAARVLFSSRAWRVFRAFSRVVFTAKAVVALKNFGPLLMGLLFLLRLGQLFASLDLFSLALLLGLYYRLWTCLINFKVIKKKKKNFRFIFSWGF